MYMCACNTCLFHLILRTCVCSIFLIDHAWTYQPQVARTQLKRIPGLASRMAVLMNLYGATGTSEVEEQSAAPSAAKEQQLDGMVQELPCASENDGTGVFVTADAN